jgi:hypothetical protein
MVKGYRDINCIKVFINDLLHIHIPLKNYIGFQSFIEGTYLSYHIQFYFQNSEPMICDYH